jgi:hypothetical protein
MKITIEVVAGPRGLDPTAEDVQKNIDALERAIDLKSLSCNDIIRLRDTVSIMEGIQKKLSGYNDPSSPWTSVPPTEPGCFAPYIGVWLQWAEESDGTEDVTWCQDKVNDDDTLYLRADCVTDAINGDIAAIEALKFIINRGCQWQGPLTPEEE